MQQNKKNKTSRKRPRHLFFLSISDMMNHLFVLVLADRKQLQKKITANLSVASEYQEPMRQVLEKPEITSTPALQQVKDLQLITERCFPLHNCFASTNTIFKEKATSSSQ